MQFIKKIELYLEGAVDIIDGKFIIILINKYLNTY